MAETTCQRCHRDITKPALVRCQDGACPLKAAPGRVSPATAIGVTAAAGIALTAILWWSSTGTAPSDPPAASAAQPVVAAPVAADPAAHRIETGGSLFGWPSKAPKPVIIDSAPAPVFDDSPDPRAASRVQSFSCDSDASIGRMLICTHWTLATADYNITLLYKDILGRSPNPRALSRARRAWLAKLDKQGTDKRKIMALYDAWRTELAKAAN